MAVATSTALIAAAVIGAGATAGASYYAAEQQEDMAEAERKRIKQAEADRKREADRIARDTRPEGETASSIVFGRGDNVAGGSASDFLVPKSGSALGVTGKSGLGFSV